MTSPATMRLMGLLVIVGMVAGCGGDEDRTRSDLSDTRSAALLPGDVVALWDEHDRVGDGPGEVVHACFVDWPVHQEAWGRPDGVCERLHGTSEMLVEASKRIRSMSQAILNGDDREARLHHDRAWVLLRTVEGMASEAREALGDG